MKKDLLSSLPPYKKQLPKEAIREFKEGYKRLYKIELTDEEANSIGLNWLLTLDAVHKQIPQRSEHGKRI